MTLERSYYTGDKIRFDGCYFNGNPELSYGAYIFYYRNGLLLSFIDKKDITSVTDFTKLYKLESNGYYWWIYKISGDTIITQTMGGVSNNSITTNYKLIINDSTFQWIKSYDSYTGTTTFDNEIYYMHFIKMNPRPDSTNIFIK